MRSECDKLAFYEWPRKAVGEPQDMNIERQHLQSVVYLCRKITRHGVKQSDPYCTGFIVNLPDPINGCSWDYLVTARHCIDEVPASEIIVRANSATQWREFTTHKNEWKTHDTADVAAILFNPPDDIDYKTVPFSALVNRYRVSPPPEMPVNAPIRRHIEDGTIQVRLGDELFFVGLLIQSAGKKKNLPIVRFGHISRLPEEIVSFKSEALQKIEVPVWLAECRSWGGHSGSPAYWYQTLHQGDLIQTPDGKTHTVVVGVNYLINLAGLVSGHSNVRQKAKTGAGEFEYQANAGMALITPADYMTELLMRNDLQEERADRVAKCKSKQSTASFDAAAVILDDTEAPQSKHKKNRDIPIPPISREKFFTDLTKATRRRKP